MNRNNIYFWQPVLTDHALFTFSSLAGHLDMNPICISEYKENKIRKLQGWSTNTHTLPIETLEDKNWKKYIDSNIKQNSDIHIINSPFEKSRINLALSLATKRRAHVFITSEPYAPIATSYFGNTVTFIDKVKAFLRPYAYYCYGLQYARHLEGVFAISPLAVQQYVKMGVPRHRVFPFGYFVPDSLPAGKRCKLRQLPPKVLRIAFVGSLIQRKGVKIACEAMKLMKHNGTLDIFGPGDPSALGSLPASVRYVGHIPFGETQTVLQNYDVLVVPSFHDGWAVVVNEAVQAGIAVVVSYETGASAMIEKWKCGLRFPAGNAHVLASKLDYLASNSDALDITKKRSVELKPFLDPDCAARYMAECIRATLSGGEPPICPWY